MPRDLFADLQPSDALDDHDLLSGLQNSQQQPKYQDSTFLEKLPANIAAGLGSLGHNILGESHREWDAIAPLISKYIPRLQDYDYSKMLGLPGTTSDKVVQGFAENAPLLGNPFGELGLIGRGIAAIPKVGGFAANALGRIVPQTLLGAATSEDALQGGKQAALTQAAIEGLPLPLKGLGKYAEAIHPVKYIKEELGKIRGGLLASEKAADEAYKPFNEIAKQYKFKNPQSYNAIYNKAESSYTPYINKLHDKFIATPTLENAHKLQSQIFTDIKELSKKGGTGVLDRVQNLHDARNALTSDIEGVLQHINPEIAASYKNGSDIIKKEVQPHYSTKDLATLVSGRVKDPQPERLKRALTSASEKGFIPDNHYLSKALENVSAKMHKAEAYKYGIPAAIAPIISHFAGYGSLPSAIMSAAAGGIVGHGAGKAAQLIQNPEIQKLLMSLGQGANKYGSPIVRGFAD